MTPFSGPRPGNFYQELLEKWEPFAVGASALLRLPRSEQKFFEIPGGGLVGVRHDKVFFPLHVKTPATLPADLRERIESGSLTIIGTPACIEPLQKHLPNVWRTMDYWFLSLPPTSRSFPTMPMGYHVKEASPGDRDRLFPLQEGYEKEEVIFTPDDYHAESSRAAFKKSLHREKHWYLEGPEGILAKAATNAQGFHWFQLGGVYTVPAHRKKGYARWVLDYAAASCSQQGIGLCLFVKKTNLAALNLYKSLGYENLGDYRIVYSF